MTQDRATVAEAGRSRATAPGWPAGVGRVVLDTIDSTNAEAARRAGAGERGPVWLLARAQSAGRGRQGRAWTMPRGNLAATFLFAPGGEPAGAALYTFTASLAVLDVVHAAGVRPRGGALKWPNDVIVGRRKVAGILLETSGGSRVDWLAIGVGINLVAAPPTASIRSGGRAATSLVEEGGVALDPEEALAHLATGFERLRALHAREGFDAIRHLWLAEAARLDEHIAVDVGATRHHGLFRGLDARGHLLIDAADGTRRAIPSADVVFPD